MFKAGALKRARSLVQLVRPVRGEGDQKDKRGCLTALDFENTTKKQREDVQKGKKRAFWVARRGRQAEGGPGGRSSRLHWDR